jgi:hypothetical protein
MMVALGDLDPLTVSRVREFVGVGDFRIPARLTDVLEAVGVPV